MDCLSRRPRAGNAWMSWARSMRFLINWSRLSMIPTSTHRVFAIFYGKFTGCTAECRWPSFSITHGINAVGLYWRWLNNERLDCYFYRRIRRTWTWLNGSGNLSKSSAYIRNITTSLRRSNRLFSTAGRKHIQHTNTNSIRCWPWNFKRFNNHNSSACEV